MNENYFFPRNPFEATGIVKRPWDQQVSQTLNDHALALHTSPFFYKIPSEMEVLALLHKLLVHCLHCLYYLHCLHSGIYAGPMLLYGYNGLTDLYAVRTVDGM